MRKSCILSLELDNFCMVFDFIKFLNKYSYFSHKIGAEMGEYFCLYNYSVILES